MKVLYIDSCEDLAEMTSEYILLKFNYDVTTITELSHISRALAENTYDVVIFGEFVSNKIVLESIALNLRALHKGNLVLLTSPLVDNKGLQADLVIEKNGGMPRILNTIFNYESTH